MTGRAPFEQTQVKPRTGGSEIEVETHDGTLKFRFGGNIRVSSHLKFVLSETIKDLVNQRAVKNAVITIDEVNDRIEIDSLADYSAWNRACARTPRRDEIADSALLFFVSDPDCAKALVGDLVERFARVRHRKSATFASVWFWWQLGMIVLYQICARIRENTLLGRMCDGIVRRIGR